MTEQEIERCLERFTMGKATDVMNFDYSGTLAYLQRLKAENADLRERLEKSYAKDTCDWAKDAGERLIEQVILKGQGWRRL